MLAGMSSGGVPRFSKHSGHLQMKKGAFPGLIERIWWEGATTLKLSTVMNSILRGRGLIRVGSGVPMVITMVTEGISEEMAAREVE